MFLDVLDDVFLLDLPLETPKGALYRFALLDLHFSHVKITPLSRVAMSVAKNGIQPNVLNYHEYARILGVNLFAVNEILPTCTIVLSLPCPLCNQLSQ